MTLWLIAFAALLVYGLARLRGARFQGPKPPFVSHRQLFQAVTIADVAFDYERALLALDDVDGESKERALWALSRVIVPLAGRVRLNDVDPKLETGVVVPRGSD